MISENDHLGSAPDSGNIFNVRSDDGGQTVLFDLFGRVVTLTRRQALLLAAWLVCIAGGDRRDFEDLLQAIRKS